MIGKMRQRPALGSMVGDDFSLAAKIKEKSRLVFIFQFDIRYMGRDAAFVIFYSYVERYTRPTRLDSRTTNPGLLEVKDQASVD